MAFLGVVVLIIVVNYINVKNTANKVESAKIDLRKAQLNYLNALIRLNGDLKLKEKIRLSDSLITVEKKHQQEIQ